MFLHLRQVAVAIMEAFDARDAVGCRRQPTGSDQAVQWVVVHFQPQTVLAHPCHAVAFGVGREQLFYTTRVLGADQVI